MTHHVLLDNVTHKDLKVRRRYTSGGGYDHNLTRAFPVGSSWCSCNSPFSMRST